MGMNLNTDFKSGFSLIEMTQKGIELMAIGDHVWNSIPDWETIGIQVTNPNDEAGFGM
jgi:hypothetical protein